MFSRDAMYGKCLSGRTSHHFHALSFRRLKTGGPFPIVGEEVEIEIQFGKVFSVHRLEEPEVLTGEVISFWDGSGWIKVDNSPRYFLHGSEVVSGVPYPGARVRFFRGHRNFQPRACWVEVLQGSYVSG